MTPKRSTAAIWRFISGVLFGALLLSVSAVPANAATVKATTVTFATGSKSLSTLARARLAAAKLDIDESSKVTIKVFTLEKNKSSAKTKKAKSLGEARLSAVKSWIKSQTGITQFSTSNTVVRSGSAATANRIEIYVVPLSKMDRCLKRSGLTSAAPIVRMFWLGINTNGSQDSLYQIHLAGTTAKTFTQGSDSSRPNIYCGGPGNDVFSGTLSSHAGHMDWFFGNGGNDTVNLIRGGGFRGGAGNDRAETLSCTPGATVVESYFGGEAGNDTVGNYDGRLTGQLTSCGSGLGGSGNDTIELMTSGSFQGDEDDDRILATSSSSWTFYGNDGNDFVATLAANQSFDGNEGADRVGTMTGGDFRGLNGDDVVEIFQAGHFNGGSNSDSILDVILDGQSLLAGRTTMVETCHSVAAASNFACPTSANQPLSLIQ